MDAVDAKGELIHQTLMAKKMAKLDESMDFRPFKFRIQAFTNGFMEDVSRVLSTSSLELIVFVFAVGGERSWRGGRPTQKGKSDMSR